MQTFKPMTVGDLVKLLNRYPQDLPVALTMYSEYALLEEENIAIQQLPTPREDGWVARKRSDKPTQSYLVIE